MSRTLVGEALAWWLVLAALFVATAPSTGRAEVVAGVVSAVPCALAAPAVRHAIGARWRWRRRWLRRVPGLLARVPGETVAVLARPLRPGSGSGVRTIRLPPEPDPAVASGRSALAALGLSATPGSVVLDIRSAGDGGDRILLHRLAGRPAPGEEAGP